MKQRLAIGRCWRSRWRWPASAVAQKETRGVTTTEIVLGMHTDLSGPAATYGVSSSNAVKMRFDEVNEKGGIHGPQDQADRGGHPVPGAARGAGGRQAHQPRPHLRHGGRRSAPR